MGQLREKAMTGRQVIGTLERNMKCRSESQERYKNNTVLPFLICFRDMDTEYSTAGMTEDSGIELCKRYMWNIKIGPRK